MKRFLFGGALGALLVYFLEPKGGARRRNVTRDRAMSLGRTVTSSSGKVAGRAGGAMQGTVPHRHDNPNPDDNTLKDRVESEVLRDPKFDRAPINFNVENGVVVIHGELQSAADIQQLVSRVRGIRDVKGVESYLHLPGTPAPNKESALRIS